MAKFGTNGDDKPRNRYGIFVASNYKLWPVGMARRKCPVGYRWVNREFGRSLAEINSYR